MSCIVRVEMMIIKDFFDVKYPSNLQNISKDNIPDQKVKDGIMTEKLLKGTFDWVRWVVAILLGAGTVFVNPTPIFAIQDDTASIQVIRSGAEIDYPPFSIVDENGKAGGFSVELMRAALAAMGREATFRTGPWAEVRGWLERGEIDALPLVGRTPEREALFDFTVPYMTLHGAIVVRAEETGILELADLEGRRVAVMEGDNAEEFLRRQERDIDIRTTPTFEIALRELAEGQHDAVVIQRLVALRLVQKTGLTDLRVIDRPIDGFQQDFCLAVREGDRDTLALLNEGLAIVVADGTRRHLHAKWFAAMQLPSDRPIVVGGDRNFPPYEFLDENGRPAGYNVDLTRAIAREMGLNVKIRLGRWPERMGALKAGKIDVMQGMFYSPDRDLHFDFTPAHTVSHYVAVMRKGEGSAPETVEALRGKRIVVETGDILHDFALEHGLEKRLTAVADQEEALRQLVNGEHDCALVSRVTALLLIRKHGWSNLVPAKKSLLASEYCYAAAKGQKALLANFSEGLKMLENSSEYRRIYDKWLGVYQETPASFLTALRYLALAVIPLLAILAAVFAWTWTLRRHVAEKTRALHNSLDRFQNVFESANVGKSITLPTGEINANQAFADFLGYAPHELTGKSWQDITPAEDVENAEKSIAPMLAGSADAVRFEKRYVHKNGQYLWADVNAAVRRDADGAPLYFMTTVVDINAKKRAEAALRVNEEYLRAVIACSPVALYTIDLDGNVTSWNRSAERIFGWRAEDIMGKPLPMVPDDKQPEFGALRRQVLKTGGFFGKELMRQKKDGTLFPVSLSVVLLQSDRGDVIGILGAAEDITERKRDQFRIEHLNQVLRAIRGVNQLIVRERDRDRLIREGCRLLVANRGYLSALIVLTDDRDRPATWAMEGMAAASEELAAMLTQGTRPPCCDHARAERDVILVVDREKVCGGCPIIEACPENQSLCAPLTHEGESFGYLAVAAENQLIVDAEECGLFREMAGDFAYALSVMRGEAARRESEARFRAMVENAPEPIFIQTALRFAYLNPRAIELFGAEDAQELLGTPVMERFHPDFHEQVKARIKALNEDSKPVKELFEQQYLRMDGSPVWVETTGHPIVYHGKNGALVFVRDITTRKTAEQERKKLEAQLIQAQKMESVGRLAGGVAHDYNNMLSLIIGYAELALDKTTRENPLREDIGEILSAALRSADITRQLLAFARKQTICPKAIDLNKTMEGMLKMLRRLIGEDIDLSWRPEPGRMPIFMDPSQLDQLLANLCVNARDAIGGVGKLTIETGRVRFDEEYCANHAGFIPGDFILLAVSDDGCGMDRDTLENIFEPFFTTKGLGEGTGLGLSTVYGIVKQNQGFINVYSEPGSGAVFKIYLPPHTKEKEGPTKAPESSETPVGRGETVMVVEDEAAILNLVQMVLKRLGYHVLTAPAPVKAMALAEEHAGEIDLLITDVVMPEMNGRELAETLQANCPELKVLFMSGYTANVIAHRGVLDEGVNFIQKPISNRELAVKVRGALEK